MQQIPMAHRSGFEPFPLLTPTIPPNRHTQAYRIGERGGLLVDPGSPYPAEQRRLFAWLCEHRGRGGTLQALVLTHHHEDHVGGAVPLARALRLPILAHPLTLSRLALPGDVRSRAVHEGQVIGTDDGLSLEVLHTPGHAAGHICLWAPRPRILVCGDMVLGGGTTVIDPPEGDMAIYLAQLRRLAALGPRFLLPGHGPISEAGAEVLDRLIAHRHAREARLAAALGPRERDLFELTREAYPEISPLALPLASRSALAHLLKLEAEGQARRSPAGAWSRPPPPLHSGRDPEQD